MLQASAYTLQETCSYEVNMLCFIPRSQLLEDSGPLFPPGQFLLFLHFVMKGLVDVDVYHPAPKRSFAILCLSSHHQTNGCVFCRVFYLKLKGGLHC